MSPSKPPRICNRCRRAVSTPCDDCAARAWAGSAWRNGSTYKWRKIRHAKLSTDPFCQAKETPQCRIMADQVDHIIPLAHGGDMYDWDNLQSICYECHDVKTQRESRHNR